MVWGINYCCPMWKEMITFFCFSLAVFGAFQAIDAQRSRKTFRSARRNCFAVRELVLSSATVRGKRFPQRRFNSQLEIEFATWAVQREIIKLGIALEKFIDNQPIKLRAIIYVFPAHVLCQRDEGLHICIIAQLKPRQIYDEEIDRLGTIWLRLHTFVRNIVGDIVPEVETTTEHAHLFNALFHIPQDTCFR